MFSNNGCSDAKLAVEMLYKTGDLAKELFSKAGDFADGANEVAKAATDAYKKADQFAKTVQGLISLMENGSFGQLFSSFWNNTFTSEDD